MRPQSHTFRAAVAAAVLLLLTLAFAAWRDQSATAAIVTTAMVETDPVHHSGDAADDAAVWVHPSNPGLSTIIGTDKLGGLGVYDLSGKELYFYPDSRPNNVDVRYNFPLGGEKISLVATSNLADSSIDVYRVDPYTRELEDVAAGALETGIRPYGLCMYRSLATDEYYVIVQDSSGTVQQWRLFDDGEGQVDAERVRRIDVGSMTEGCVADDELGHLYVAEEDVALWKYGAEPDTGSERTRVDSVGSEGNVVSDLEGLAIYYAPNGGGYLIASSQGSDDYAVYERQGANAYVTRFSIASDAVDGTSHTDGIDVLGLELGNRFPEGVFIAQDDRNGSEFQNFKLVPWGRVARGGEVPLDIDTRWDPRRHGALGGHRLSGTFYHVDAESGSDSNSGTSEDQAWRTLAKASTAPLMPGDRLLLKRGQTYDGPLELHSSGLFGRRIIVDVYGEGPLPVITGATSCVKVTGSFYIVRDLNPRGCTWAGIDIAGDNNRIRWNIIERNAAGVYVRESATGNRILNNRIMDNNRMSVNTADDPNNDSGAFGVLIRGESTTVARNVISGSDAFSYDYGRDGAAIEILNAKKSFIHRNLARDNDAFSELGGGETADTTFLYNIVHSSLDTSSGVVTRGGASARGPVLGTKLYNNTIVLTGLRAQGFVCHGGCAPNILRMRNNIVQSGWKVGYADAAFDENYDLVSGPVVQFTLGPQSLRAAPGFIDPLGVNVNLLETSPAVDRGAPLGVPSDYLRLPVPEDGDGNGTAVPDIGALEYRPPAPPESP